MNFSFCAISRDEEKTLPRLIASLRGFQERGGACVLLDTGSTDKTVEIARAAGWIVEEVGEVYLHTINAKLAKAINKQFIVEGEEDCVNAGQKYFDFASARNHCASLSPTDMVSFVDCDEVMTGLDIDTISKYIDEGYNQFSYKFVFSHRPDGSPMLEFTQSKFYDRRTLRWDGIVHECLQGEGKLLDLPPEVFHLEHWQNLETDRHSYLKGLAVDCYQNPGKDRNSHYFARELFWGRRLKSAIKEFERHVAMYRWAAERAESLMFIGDAYGTLGKPELQHDAYARAYMAEPERREPLMRLANFYKTHNRPRGAKAFATAALTVPRTDYYATGRDDYEQGPEDVLYWAEGWLGNIPAAREHLLKALDYQPNNARYLEDMRYYFEYWGNNIDGWMSQRELQFLYELGKQYKEVVEIGSWKGRSTHALAAGGNWVVAVDTFKGSSDVNDLTNQIAQQEDIKAQFIENTKEYADRIEILCEESTNAAKRQMGRREMRAWGQEGIFGVMPYDVIFIDAGHTYEEVKADIEAWMPLAGKIICGDDYLPGVWDGVVQAVDEMFGKPDRVIGKIWIKYLDDTSRSTLPDYL